MKLVGGDSGRCECEAFVDELLMIAPSGRAVVDVLFDRPGETTLEHRTPDGRTGSARSGSGGNRRTPRCGAVADAAAEPGPGGGAGPHAVDLDREPDNVLALVAETTMKAAAAAPVDPTDEGRAADRIERWSGRKRTMAMTGSQTRSIWTPTSLRYRAICREERGG
jgi:hypothetical protein